jgi:hypothetical protein
MTHREIRISLKIENKHDEQEARNFLAEVMALVAKPQFDNIFSGWRDPNAADSFNRPMISMQEVPGQGGSWSLIQPADSN